MKLKFYFFTVLISIFCTSFAFAEKGNPVAQIGSLSITLDEVDQLAKDDLARVDQQIFSIRRNALNQLIEKKLLELEAKSQNITVEELEKKIRAAAQPVTEDDIKKFYDTSRGPQQLPYEQEKGKIENYLKSKAFQGVRKKTLNEYRKKYSVKVTMKVPRVSIDNPKVAPAKGPEKASIQITFFSDFQCPFCKRGSDNLTQVFQNNPGKVRVIFRNYPLPFHPSAPGAAEAALCVGEQNQFWPYADTLFNHQNALDRDSLRKYAAGLALDLQTYDSCMASGRHKKDVEQDTADGRRYGVNGTPAFFINGRPLEGAVPAESFQEIIDEELSSNV